MKTFSARARYLPISRRSGTSHAFRRVVSAILALTFAGVSGGVAVGQAADLTGTFKGGAFTTFANSVTGQVASQLAEAAYQPCPCHGTNGQVLSSTVKNVRAGNNGMVLSAGATVSTVYSNRSANRGIVRNTATVSRLNLLNGMITASSVKAVAIVNATKTAVATDVDNSTFTDLKIAGNPFGPDVAANTQIALPGLGKLTLKKVQQRGDLNDASRVSVQMLTVDINQTNSFGLPVGSQIVVASATATFNRSQQEPVVGENARALLASATTEAGFGTPVGLQALAPTRCGDAGSGMLPSRSNVSAPATPMAPGTRLKTAFDAPQSSGATEAAKPVLEPIDRYGTYGALIGAAVELPAASILGRRNVWIPPSV